MCKPFSRRTRACLSKLNCRFGRARLDTVAAYHYGTPDTDNSERIIAVADTCVHTVLSAVVA